MDEVRQVVVHPAVWASLEAWLKARGILLVNIDSVLDGDDIPTYVMHPISLDRPREEDQ